MCCNSTTAFLWTQLSTWNKCLEPAQLDLLTYPLGQGWGESFACVVAHGEAHLEKADRKRSGAICPDGFFLLKKLRKMKNPTFGSLLGFHLQILNCNVFKTRRCVSWFVQTILPEIAAETEVLVTTFQNLFLLISVQHRLFSSAKIKCRTTQMGLEPTIPSSGGWCLIH